jgi:hypothetical protein
MVTFTTSGCRRHKGHREFTIQFLKPLIPNGERVLLDYFESAVAKGETFEAGHTVELGGHGLRLVDRPDGTLGVEEPVPAPTEQWVEAVDRTVREVTFQRWIAESVDLPVTFPARDADCLVSACVQTAESLVLSRVEVPADLPQLSGWMVSCPAKHDHGERSALPLLALSAIRPFTVQFLALPVGTVVLVVPPGKAHVFFNGAPVTPAAGSYLEGLNTRNVGAA